MRVIISSGLYIFYPISKGHFFVFKEVFSQNSGLMYGLYSRAASNQERPMMARVRYSKKSTKFYEISTLLLFTVHTDKNKVEISQNLVAFSEYKNFNLDNKLVTNSLKNYLKPTLNFLPRQN